MRFKNGADSADDRSQFNVGHIRAGDIIFFDSNSPRFWSRLKRNVNVIGQRLLAATRHSKHRISIFDRIPKYSHVILGLDGGIVIHADGKSVEIEVITDALHIATAEQAHYTIYRHKDISDVTRQKISLEAIRYYSQKYSFSPFFQKSSTLSNKSTSSNEDTTQFCSRLVAYVYRVAGVELSNLPDHKVLPVDLFKVCSLPPWEDITQDFMDDNTSSDLDERLGSITMPNGEEVTLSTFMRSANALLKDNAIFNAELQKIAYKSLKDLLINESLLAKFCSAQLDMAKLVSIKPDEIHGDVTDLICKTLEQIEDLLLLATTLDLKLITPDILSNFYPDDRGRGAYVNFPSTATMRELQLNREVIRIYAGLLFAQAGIFVILAHYVPNEKYRIFEAVNRDTADRFLTSVLQIRVDLSTYDNFQELFVWIEDDIDRSTSQKIFNNIVTGLRLIDFLRSANGIDSNQ